MRKTIRKFFVGWGFDKEEQWLNEMAARGLALISVGFCRYDFEECVPGEYQIRLELLDTGSEDTESENYIKFLEETGVQHVGTYFRWAYFRKKTADGSFQLFSDNHSRILHLTRIIRLILLVGCFNLFIAGFNLYLLFFQNIASGILGTINAVIGAFCLFGLIHLFLKRKRLRREQQIFE